MFKVILVPTDGTTQSNHAVKTAATLATNLGATLTIFHASRTYPIAVLRGRRRNGLAAQGAVREGIISRC
jgi:nucleotide-binding universal stress UspA family protein